MRKKILLIILCFACVGWISNGGWDSGTYYARSINYPTERAITSDTLTAGERGKTFSVDCTSVCEFELPVATPGTSFTFISEAAEVFFVDPADGDTIHWSVAGTHFVDGEKMESPGATNDTLTVISTETNYWSVSNISGSWTNGGT